MPDLIIKPTATSGNKLILKDQAGGAVLTTADSGATLGTISGGTLTSGVTFPAGMTLQTKVAQIAESISGITATGASTEIHSGLRIDFTPVSSSSKIIFTLHAGNAIAQSADIELRIRYHTTSNTAPNSNFGNNKISGDRQGANAQIFTLNHLTFEDSWSGLRCVSPCYGSSNGNTVTISNSTHVTFFMIQEIAQ